jgi:hypothetical protein
LESRFARKAIERETKKPARSVNLFAILNDKTRQRRFVMRADFFLPENYKKSSRLVAQNANSPPRALISNPLVEKAFGFFSKVMDNSSHHNQIELKGKRNDAKKRSRRKARSSLLRSIWRR